jgi:hypothetical protein
MVALVVTIHVLTLERLGERHFTGRRLPCASQDVDARDKPEHDGERAATSSFLLSGGRRWRECGRFATLCRIIDSNYPWSSFSDRTFSITLIDFSAFDSIFSIESNAENDFSRYFAAKYSQ